MCGIIGQFRQRRCNSIDRDVFDQMVDSLSHRGPDGRGVKYFENDYVALGHRRLSIIDLSNNASQPMSNQTNSLWITFNGEIYNFRALRKELEALGRFFCSDSDTEVIVAGYEIWGIDKLLSKLKGMFAFGLWDANSRELFLCRDRFGIKPLYYYYNSGEFCFASELKSIYADSTKKKRLSYSSIADYFIYSYVPNPNTIWEDAFKVPPASYLVYSYDDNAFKVSKYWELSVSEKKYSFDDVCLATHDLLNNSVKEHLESDVPVGLFLSGGYDSSTLLLKMVREGVHPNTFSIGFQGSERSEHYMSSTIAAAFNTNHYEQVLDGSINYLEDLTKLAYHYDEPFAVSSMLPYYYVSRLSSGNNKVVLAGDGGDELLAGYRWHDVIKKRFSSPSFKQRIKDLVFGEKKSFVSIYNQWMTGALKNGDRLDFLSKGLRTEIFERKFWLFDREYPGYIEDPLKRCQYMDVQTFIPEPALTRADRSSMANSLEVRVPFLDHELFEFVFSLKSSCYFKDSVKKPVLADGLKGRIPDTVFDMPKNGFSFQTLGEIFNDETNDLLLRGKLMENKVLLPNLKLNSLTLNAKFHLLMLELWFRRFY